MAGSVYELAILLTLKDAASGGLGRVEDRLRATGRTGKATLQTFQDLRSELKKDLTIAGVGVTSLLTLKKGLDVAGDYESALLDIRSAYQESAAAGALSLQAQEVQLKGLGNLAVDLGNKLQGNTKNYVGILTALKQAGLPGEQVLGGAGRSAAYLANVSGALSRGQEREQAKELGQFGLMFKLRPEEFETSVNLFSALKDKFDIESSSLIESAKYFQATSNQLGISGARGAEDTVKFFALLKRNAGMEGSMAGTGARAFFMQLATEEKKLKELKKATGIELRPFDDKGTFRGYEAIFREMEKFRTLNQQQSAMWLNKIFGERGQEVASAMVKVGFEGWEKVTAETAKAVPVNEKINQQMSTYNAKVEALTGSIQNLTATAFMPMLDTVKPLVDLANQGAGALQGWAAAYPGVTQLAGSLFGMGAVALTVVGGVRAMSTAWRMWRIASSVGVSETGQLTFLRTLRTEAAMTSTALGTATTKAGGLRTALGAATTKASGLRTILGGMPAQIGVAIGLEYTITKGIELYQEMQNYREARAQEQRADALGAKSLAAVESDYKKRGEPVPSEVYSGRALVSLESLNRKREPVGPLGTPDLGAATGELREALEPGSHFFRELTKGFTFQPQNPYVNPLGMFSPSRAAEGFRERAPELGNPEVMRAFIAELGKFKLPAEQQGQYALAGIQRKEIGEALQMAFPQSYQQATLLATQGLNDLQQPLNVLPASLTKTGDSAMRLASNFDRFSSRLAGFELPTIPTITISGQTTQTGQPTTTTGKPADTHRYQVIPGRAAGGLVLKGGLVEVHDREAIVPARVTDRWRDETFHDRESDSTSSLISQLVSMKSESVRPGPVVASITIVVPAPAGDRRPATTADAAAPTRATGFMRQESVSDLRSNRPTPGVPTGQPGWGGTVKESALANTRATAPQRESDVSQFSGLRSEIERSATRLDQLQFNERNSTTRESLTSEFSNLRSESSDRSTVQLIQSLQASRPIPQGSPTGQPGSGGTLREGALANARATVPTPEALISQISNLRSESERTVTSFKQLRFSDRNSVRSDARESLVSQFANLRSESERTVTSFKQLRFSDRDSVRTEVRESLVSQFANLRSESFDTRAKQVQLLSALASAPVADRAQLSPEVVRSVAAEGRGHASLSNSETAQVGTSPAAARAIHVTYAPKIEIHGGTTGDVVAQVRSIIAQHSEELVRQIEYELEIQRERA